MGRWNTIFFLNFDMLMDLLKKKIEKEINNFIFISIPASDPCHSTSENTAISFLSMCSWKMKGLILFEFFKNFHTPTLRIATVSL
jgi:hypothetical protein